MFLTLSGLVSVKHRKARLLKVRELAGRRKKVGGRGFMPLLSFACLVDVEWNVSL